MSKKKEKNIIIITENIVDMEPVSPSPVVVALGGIQYPPIFSTNVEFIGRGGGG
jgi:hypothetical protein